MTRLLHTGTILLAVFLLLGSLPVAAVERPFGMSGSGNVEFTDNPPGGHVTASGIATYLGQWAQDGTLSFNFVDSMTILASGKSIFTAADGDQLHAVITDAVLNPTTGIATGAFIFVGGTGRFEFASGSADFVVQQDPAGPFEVTAVGTIDF